jgi:hypothetical protein
MFAASVDQSTTLTFMAFIIGNIDPWTSGIYAITLRFNFAIAVARGAFHMNIVFHFSIPLVVDSHHYTWDNVGVNNQRSGNMKNHDPNYGDNTTCDLCKDVFDARNSPHETIGGWWICGECVDTLSDFFATCVPPSH